MFAKLWQKSSGDRMSIAKNQSPIQKTVCHITTVHPADDIRIFHKECHSLVGAGYDVHLIACHDTDETRDGVKIHALPFPPGRITRIGVWPILALWKILRLKRRPMLCHFHDPELLPLGQFLRIIGYKVIFDVHENVPEQIRHKRYLSPFLRIVFSGFYWFLERVLCFRLASVHVLESIAKNFRQPRQVVRNLPRLGVMPQYERPAEGSACRLIYVGNITVDRGALTMIKVAAELARRNLDFELYLVGEFETSELLDESVDFVREAGIEKQVIITGKKAYPDAQALIRSCDIGLCLLLPIPNHTNSLSTKLLEYMRMELPVVASDFACWREFVIDIESGIMVNVESIESISDGVQELIADQTKRAYMGANGLRAVTESLNWEVEHRRLLTFYDFLLGDDLN